METPKDMKCMLTYEQALKNVLNCLEDNFKKHWELYKATIDDQKKIIDELWVLSQRFLILTRGAICVSPYPREQSDKEERFLRDEFSFKKTELKRTNSILMVSLQALQSKCRLFDLTLSKLDTRVPNHITEGTADRPPIQYFIELYRDFMKFIGSSNNEMHTLAGMLTVDDIKLIVQYRNLLQPDEIAISYFESSLLSKGETSTQ